MFMKYRRLTVRLIDIKTNPSEEVLSLSRRSPLFTELFGEPRVILKKCQIQEEDPVHIRKKRYRNLEFDEEEEDPVYVRKKRHKNLESDEEEDDEVDVGRKVLRIMESDEEKEEEINVGKSVSRNIKSNEEYVPKNESEEDSDDEEYVTENESEEDSYDEEYELENKSEKDSYDEEYVIENESEEDSYDEEYEPENKNEKDSYDEELKLNFVTKSTDSAGSAVERRDWKERIIEFDSDEDSETTKSSLSDEEKQEDIENSENDEDSHSEEEKEDMENSEDDEDPHSESVIKSSYEKMIEEKRAERIAFLKALEIDEVKASYREAVIARKKMRQRTKKKDTKSENGLMPLRKSSRLANLGVSINFSVKALFKKAMIEANAINGVEERFSVYQDKYDSDSESSEDSVDDIIFQDESSSDSVSSEDSVQDIIFQAQTDDKMTYVLKERIKPIERTFRSSRLRRSCAANSINFNEKSLYLKSVIETLEVKDVEHKKEQPQKKLRKKEEKK